MPVGQQIASPEGKRRYVRKLFATIADRYDLITRVLSYGQDRRWKRRVVALAAPVRGTRALDLATGTGDIAVALAARGADVVGLDITLRMIELALARASQPGGSDSAGSGTLHFLVGDMLALPFPNGSFDLVTTGYGLRNVPDLTTAIAEIHRVLTPRGRLLSLDFNRPSNPFVRGAYLSYLSVVGGALGWLLHRDADTYRYIPASIRQYPGADAVRRLMASLGFDDAHHYRVLGGLMAIHDARKHGR